MVDEESALVSIYAGEDTADEDADKMAEVIRSKYPDLEVELEKGGQPVYYYVFSVE